MTFRERRFLLLAVLVALPAATGPHVAADDMPAEDAWRALPKYQYGQDMGALLAIDRVVIRAMASPESRSACAARLAAVLEAPGATLAARQYICFQLRQVGTSAEVSVLARLLEKPDTSQMARHALEAVPGEESLAALRNSLQTLKGKLLVGVINSVAARKDARSVPKLQGLVDSDDEQVAWAALWALGNIAGDQAAAFLSSRAEKARIPAPRNLAVPLLRCADALAAAGKTERAQAIYTKLSRAGQASGIRRSALEGLLRLQGERAGPTILAWFAGTDAQRRVVASGHLKSLSDEQLDRLAMKLADLPDAGKLILLEVLAPRKGKGTLSLIISAARSDKPELRLAGIRCLGLVGDASAVPLLIDSLSAGGELTEAAQEALCRLPRKDVGKALLDALNEHPDLRVPVIEVLKKLKHYEAIDPLIAMAAEKDPAIYGPALDGLRGIADPDDHDIPRLVKLLLKTPQGRHRDEVEKTIVIVCEKLPHGTARAQPVLAALAKLDRSESPKYLPLLGRLGGPKVLEIVDSALGSGDPEIKQAAVRALSNWPGAEVAERLLDIAGRSDNKSFRQWALRAYIRVTSLKSDRPEARTLAMLQSAMKLAENTADKQLVLRRASTVRTMEAVCWIAEYLDDPDLAQAACRAIVDLAHHRFLRQPNMSRWAPILEKVSRISKDPGVAERAKKYRLGL